MGQHSQTRSTARQLGQPESTRVNIDISVQLRQGSVRSWINFGTESVSVSVDSVKRVDSVNSAGQLSQAVRCFGTRDGKIYNGPR
ncbi:hypothetical protein Hanom_Chr11g01015971 [Helianthus anomalus]